MKTAHGDPDLILKINKYIQLIKQLQITLMKIMTLFHIQRDPKYHVLIHW